MPIIIFLPHPKKWLLLFGTKPGNNTHRPIRAGGKQVGERVKEQTGKQTGRTGNGAGIHTGSGIH